MNTNHRVEKFNALWQRCKNSLSLKSFTNINKNTTSGHMDEMLIEFNKIIAESEAHGYIVSDCNLPPTLENAISAVAKAFNELYEYDKEQPVNFKWIAYTIGKNIRMNNLAEAISKLNTIHAAVKHIDKPVRIEISIESLVHDMHVHTPVTGKDFTSVKEFITKQLLSIVADASSMVDAIKEAPKMPAGYWWVKIAGSDWIVASYDSSIDKWHSIHCRRYTKTIWLK